MLEGSKWTKYIDEQRNSGADTSALWEGAWLEERPPPN